MRPARTLFRGLFWSGLLLLLLPLGLIAALMTEPGSTWLLRQAPSLLRPLGIEFDFGRSQGSLLNRLELHEVRFTLDESRFEAARLLLEWQPLAAMDGALHIRALELSDVQLVLPASAESAAGAPEIPDIVLPVRVQLDRFLLERLRFEQGETRLSVTRAALAAQFNESGLAVRDLFYEGGGVRLEGMLSMQGKAPHALSGEISAVVDQSLTGEEIGAVEAAAVLGGRALIPEFNLTLNSPARMQLRGSLKLDQPEPGFDILAEWRELSWPLQATAAVTAQAGRLALNGTASAYKLELKTGLSGEDVPRSDIDLLAQGDLQGMNLQPLKLDLLDGRLQISGELGWQEKIRWNLKLLAEQINPGLYKPDWPGRLDGRIDVSGTLAGESPDQLFLQTRIHKLEGELRGQRISAGGELDYRAGEMLARKLELASGPNRIYLDGRADERLDLSFDIKAPELASLYPGLSGRLEGAGLLKGTRKSPAVTANINGQALAYQEIRTQELKLNLNWQESGGRGELRLTGLDAQGTQIPELSAALNGTPASHRLNLEMKGSPYGAGLTARGGMRERAWEGAVTRLTLEEPALGEWMLKAPAKLRLSETLVRAEPICMTQSAASVCIEGGWSSERGVDVVGGLRGFQLSRLKPLIPGAAVIEGALQGDFKLIGTPARPNLRFQLQPGDGVIRIEDKTQPFEIAYRNTKISGRFDNDQGSVDLNFELGSRGKAQGQLMLGAEDRGTRSLGGKVSVEFPDLALVSGFVPALERVQGRMHVEAVLGGTLEKPQATGILQVENAQAELPTAGIALSEVQLTARGDGKTPLRIQGGLKSGSGRLKLDGTVDLAAAGAPVLDLNLTGENFQAARLPEALVEISPDLRLVGSGPFHLSGTLLIPKATIEIREIPSGTVALSEDEIIIGQEVAQKPAATTQNLTAGVRVVLGKLVTFSGFGLKTGLTGAVDARVDNNGTSVNGKIELKNGSYKSYGQDLKVEQGRLLFAGPPANPDVDLRAVRVSRDESVKALLVLSGPLSKPRPRVYSEPPLPDAEALAYLLTGNGLKQANQKEGANIAGAALSLGVSKSEPLLQQLGDRLGLDELSVESDRGIEESSLILGKYLNPDLYLGYSQGLFTPEGAVLLRLKLSERLHVESRSGSEQSVDLFYRLEHD